MKDIKHYFTNSPKDNQSSSIAQIEVRGKSAKVDNNAAPEEKDLKTKEKRNRVKIKITRKSNSSATCNIVQSFNDCVDKTPSPSIRSKKKTIVSKLDSPKSVSQKSYEINSECSLRKLSGNEINNIEGTNVMNDESNPQSTNSSLPTQTDQSIKKIDMEIDNTNQGSWKSTREQVKLKQKQKLTILADQKGYSKRKIREEEEATKIEKRLEKRKRMFTKDPITSIQENSGDENIPKSNEVPNLKQSHNLLSYFSKATPDLLEKERLMKTKVTVTAEIHTPQNSLASANHVIDKKHIMKEKTKYEAKKFQDEFDEIKLIQSETLVLSPKNEKITQIKPKWSMKIQLQSTSNNTSTGTLSNGYEDIYTPTAKLKLFSDNKNNEEVPKILLPINNKKSGINNSSSNFGSPSHKTRNRINSNNYEEKMKDINLKIESNRQIEVEDYQIMKENPVKRKSEEKLAPLFTKKAKHDPETIAARQIFLRSDIQEKKSMNVSKKSTTSELKILPFPKISHINEHFAIEDILHQKHTFSFKSNENFELELDLTQWKTVTQLYDDIKIPVTSYECLKTNISSLLSEVETYCSDAQSLWKSICKFSKSTNVKRTFKSRRKNNEKINSNDSVEDLKSKVLNDVWTDKYKPNSSIEIVGNEDAALKLKTWLDGWNVLSENVNYSSSEEFYGSDCSSSSSGSSNHVAVLIGPCGSGKTACVYAVAQELGYKVLEVNASSRRPGKKILKDFEEATKSHRVKEASLRDSIATNSKKNEGMKKISQNSLILMEDVDLIFEEDDGFVSATFQLASNTKRPIVMTLTNVCSHLSKLAPQQLRIDFEPVYGKRVATLFQLITLAETGHKLPRTCFQDLCQNGDLRRNLLQLQYLLLSGRDRISYSLLAVNNLSWKDMQTNIYKPLIKADRMRKKEKIQQSKMLNDEILNSLAKHLDYFALVSDLMDIDNPTSNSLHFKSEPSISLIENATFYSSLQSISLDIGNCMNDAMKNIVSKKSKILYSQSQDSIPLLTRKQIINGVDSALSQIATNTLDRRALAIDYLSSIRTICRSEEVRNKLNSKRGNRFFHYFQASKLTSGPAKSGNILSAACKMLQEKTVPGSEM